MTIPKLRELGVLHRNWTVVHIMNRERNMSASAASSSPLYSPDLPQGSRSPLFKQALVQSTSTLLSPRSSVSLQQVASSSGVGVMDSASTGGVG